MGPSSSFLGVSDVIMEGILFCLLEMFGSAPCSVIPDITTLYVSFSSYFIKTYRGT